MDSVILKSEALSLSPLERTRRAVKLLNRLSDPIDPPAYFSDSRDYGISSEWLDWYRLTPQQRWEESGHLRDTFLTLGGSLEPEPDTESPFFDAETWSPLPADGRPGLRILRGCGI
jgi:hypothetical protein